MRVTPFAIERFFAAYEFTAPYLLCASDCETISVAELLELGGSNLAELGELRLGYTESPGAQTLRESITAGYTTLTPDHVMVLAAPEEGIFLTMQALLEAGDRVVVLSPAYDSLGNIAQDLGCEVVRWWLQPETSGWRLDLAALEALLAVPTRMLVVNFPHNPTGYLPSADEQRQIFALAETAGCRIFSDEMYRGLELRGRTALPAGCDLSEQAISLGGLSKTYGLPGLRSGWLALHDAELRRRLLEWKDYTTICAPGPSEFLAEVALRAADSLAARSRALIEHNMVLADDFFARHGERFSWRPPQAGSVALVGVNDPKGATAFAEHVLEGCGVLLLPATNLGYDDAHVRLGLGRESFAPALKQLDSWLQRL